MSNWNEKLNERLQREKKEAFEAQMRARREFENAPKPYRDPRSEKERKNELKYIVDQLGFKNMLEDVKRNIWNGRGKINSEFEPDYAFYSLNRSGQESYFDSTPDGGWTTQWVSHTLKIGAKRREANVLLYINSPWCNEEYPYPKSESLGTLQSRLLDAGYNTR